MPAKTKKLSKSKEIDSDSSEIKPLNKVSFSEETVAKPATKAVVEEVKTNVVEPETSVEKTNPIEKASEEATSSSKITSFSQLDTSSASPVINKEVSTKSILEPDEEPSSHIEDSKKDTELASNEVDALKATSDKGEISSDEIKEWLKEVRPDTTKEVEKASGTNLSSVLIVLIILLLLGLAGGGIYYYRTRVISSAPKEVPQTTQSSEPTTNPTATPAAEDVDYSIYTLRVVNGSGVTGEANRVSKLFEEFEFKEISTGNADNSNYTTTIISMKEEVPEKVFDKIKDILSNDYIVEKAEKASEATSSYDILITVGTKKS